MWDIPPRTPGPQKLPSQTSAHPRPNPDLNLTLSTEDVFTAHELNQTELTCNESTQLRYAFIGHARELWIYGPLGLPTTFDYRDRNI